MEQGGAEEITDRSERGGGRGEMRSEGGRDRGGEEIRKLYKYLKEIQKWGDFYQRVGEGKCSKKWELLPKEGRDWREGRGRKSYNLQVKDTADFLMFNSFSQVGTYFM